MRWLLKLEMRAEHTVVRKQLESAEAELGRKVNSIELDG